jgi:hypothetical protein
MAVFAVTCSSVAVGLAVVEPPVNPAEGDTAMVIPEPGALAGSSDKHISKFAAIPVCRSTIHE